MLAIVRMTMSQEPRKLDHKGVIPLYYQLKEIILEKIERGDWGVGYLIPSESELQKAYGITPVQGFVGPVTRAKLNELFI